MHSFATASYMGTLEHLAKKNVWPVAKKWLPAGMVRELMDYSKYQRNERSIYLRTRLSHHFGLLLSRPPRSARSFLFVCFGNIMRSPMCEVLMQRALAELPIKVSVSSAGTDAVPGRPAHPWALLSAEELGVSLDGHRARALTSEMIDRADAIVVMDYQNRVQLLSRWKQASGKVFMLGACAREVCPEIEIRDPYYSDQAQCTVCYQIINTCITNLVRSLRGEVS
jgi:protein-tyrosine phosphatase